MIRSASSRPWNGTTIWPSLSRLPHTRGPLGDVVERVADEQLERRVLLLDHQDVGEAGGEVAHVVAIERERHHQLEQPDAAHR